MEKCEGEIIEAKVLIDRAFKAFKTSERIDDILEGNQ